jgi:hypothetical protein
VHAAYVEAGRVVGMTLGGSDAKSVSGVGLRVGSKRDAQNSRLRRTTLERIPEIVGMSIVILSWTVRGNDGGRGDHQAARPNAGVIRVTHPDAVRANSPEGLHRGRWGGCPAV